MVEFIQGTTVTSEVYCETLKEMHRAIQNKRRGMLTYGVQECSSMTMCVHMQLLAR
jgi:hypothetical protein